MRGELRKQYCRSKQNAVNQSEHLSNDIATPLWYAYLHVLFTHSDSLTALWWISLKAVAVIRPW